MNSHNGSGKPDWVPPRSVKLLDQVRVRVRYLHDSLQTEKAYVYWAKAFVLWAARSNGGFRYPRVMGQAAEIEGFLSMLATEKQVAPATHRQALNALLFMHRQVLGMELPWMQLIGRLAERKRIPVVLTVQEAQSLLGQMAGIDALLAALLYGSGRLHEALGLRVKDVDFDRHAIIVRSGKGDKDRVVMLPRALAPRLQAQLAQVRAVLLGQDRATKRGVVFLPYALGRMYPRTGESWAWFWVFPSPKLSVDPQTGVERRHHLFEERLNRQLKKAGGHRQTCIRPHFAPGIHHPLAAGGCRHPHGAGAAGVFGVSTTMIYTHLLRVAAGGTTSPLDVLAFEPCRTVLGNVGEGPQWVETSSSRVRKAAAGAASPIANSPRSAVPPIAAARARDGGRTEGQLHGGHNELACQHRPAPHAAKPPLARMVQPCWRRSFRLTISPQPNHRNHGLHLSDAVFQQGFALRLRCNCKDRSLIIRCLPANVVSEKTTTCPHALLLTCIRSY